MILLFPLHSPIWYSLLSFKFLSIFVCLFTFVNAAYFHVSTLFLCVFASEVSFLLTEDSWVRRQNLYLLTWKLEQFAFRIIIERYISPLSFYYFILFQTLSFSLSFIPFRVSLIIELLMFLYFPTCHLLSFTRSRYSVFVSSFLPVRLLCIALAVLDEWEWIFFLMHILLYTFLHLKNN